MNPYDRAEARAQALDDDWDARREATKPTTSAGWARVGHEAVADLLMYCDPPAWVRGWLDALTSSDADVRRRADEAAEAVVGAYNRARSEAPTWVEAVSLASVCVTDAACEEECTELRALVERLMAAQASDRAAVWAETYRADYSWLRSVEDEQDVESQAVRDPAYAAWWLA